jgi:flagellar biosynthesis component FlhA
VTGPLCLPGFWLIKGGVANLRRAKKYKEKKKKQKQKKKKKKKKEKTKKNRKKQEERQGAIDRNRGVKTPTKA